MNSHKPMLWTPGDWNALFGFGTNILVNFLVLTGLLLGVVKLPPEIVFGRILPATGLMLCLTPCTTRGSRIASRETGRTMCAHCRPASACRTCSPSLS